MSRFESGPLFFEKQESFFTEEKMKLFVWENCLVDYTAGIMVAIAHDPEEARKILAQELGGFVGDLAKPPDEYPLDSPVAFYVWGGG